MEWITKSFQQLSNDELYDLLKLRCDVFIVEQTCYYPDLDDKDREPGTIHLLCYNDSELVGYLRALAPGISYDDYASIGRVIVLPSTRGSGLGHELMSRGNKLVDKKWQHHGCKISAQYHLRDFYSSHGFKVVGETYLEDGIPHIAMTREI